MAVVNGELNSGYSRKLWDIPKAYNVITEGLVQADHLSPILMLQSIDHSVRLLLDVGAELKDLSLRYRRCQRNPSSMVAMLDRIEG
jgi:hypothetical protein